MPPSACGARAEAAFAGEAVAEDVPPTAARPVAGRTDAGLTDVENAPRETEESMADASMRTPCFPDG